MPLNTIGALVIMLILVFVMLLMVSNSTGRFFGILKDKLNVPTHTPECKIKCYNCCNYEGPGYPGKCGTTADKLGFETHECDCNC